MTITLIICVVFFMNERFFYGTGTNLWIHIALCILLGVQLIFSICYAVWQMKKEKLSINKVILPLISIAFICLAGMLVFGGGIWNGEFHSIQNLDMRLFFPQELDSYLEWAGFKIIHKFGSFEEEAFNDNSEKQIFVCQCWDDRFEVVQKKTK